MTPTDWIRRKRSWARAVGACPRARCTLLLIGLGTAGIAAAQDDTGWRLLLEPMYMDAYGHDQQILTIEGMDATAGATARTPVSLGTEAGYAFRFELEWAREGPWDLGVDGFLFSASRGRPARTAAADGPGGPIDAVAFNAWDRSYASTGPGEALYFEVLGDTDVAVWNIDVYGLRTLRESADGGLRLALGLRSGDFDNDFHGQAGTTDVNGSFFDAASNYDLMLGPLVGIAGDAPLGGGTIRAYIGQSVLFGTTQLTYMTRDFTGPASDTAPIVGQQASSRTVDVAIPITDLRVNWLRPISDRLSLGVAANASIWWDVSVPPNVVPAVEQGASNENTIVFFGIGAAVGFDF